MDYFDTDKAAKACKTLRIPAGLDGCPIDFHFERDSAFTGVISDSFYTNDTVQKLILEEGIPYVESFAFSRFTALKTVQLPSTVQGTRTFFWFVSG